MTISDRNLGVLAGAGSAGLLIAALGFQAIGYVPCELCILQRWPHLVAAIIAVVVLVVSNNPIWRWLGALATATACGIAFYHVGVEQGWWEGPTACTGTIRDLATMSTQDLMTQLQSAPVVRCDEPQWYFLGLTMAAWNAICSAILTVIWAISARGWRPTVTQAS